MPRMHPSRFVHVVYRTRRFDEMVRWYQTVFDARVQHRDPALAFLTYDDEHHRFAFANLDVLQPGGASEASKRPASPRSALSCRAETSPSMPVHQCIDPGALERHARAGDAVRARTQLCHTTATWVFTAYVPSQKDPAFMSLLERTFGKETTTRTLDTVRRCARA